MAILTTNGIFFSAGNELNSRRQLFPTSTVWSYFQAAAPTGWTKIITQDNKALVKFLPTSTPMVVKYP